MRAIVHAIPRPTMGPQVRAALMDVLDEHWHPLEGAVVLRLRFVWFRHPDSPAAIPLTEAPLPILVRAVLDELQGVVYRDERQVAAIHAAKEYGRWNGATVEC